MPTVADSELESGNAFMCYMVAHEDSAERRAAGPLGLAAIGPLSDSYSMRAIFVVVGILGLIASAALAFRAPQNLPPEKALS